MSKIVLHEAHLTLALPILLTGNYKINSSAANFRTVYLRGIAAPRAEVFEVPLGPLAVNLAAIAAIADLPEVVLDDVPHARDPMVDPKQPSRPRSG